MPTNIKGPAIFLAQFAGDAAPFNSWDSITKWAASLGYKGVQMQTWDGRFIDLGKAAESKTYCDELKGVAKANGIEITELASHLTGHMVAVNPEVQRHVLRRSRLALCLSISAAPGWPGGDGFRGAGEALEADPGYL
jgi:sugar phosphate isomerase/epimerase